MMHGEHKMGKSEALTKKMKGAMPLTKGKAQKKMQKKKK